MYSFVSDFFLFNITLSLYVECVYVSFIFIAVWYSIWDIYHNLSTLLLYISFAAVNYPSVPLAPIINTCLLLLILVNCINLCSFYTHFLISGHRLKEQTDWDMRFCGRGRSNSSDRNSLRLLWKDVVHIVSALLIF